jgi:hypothetical protein
VSGSYFRPGQLDRQGCLLFIAISSIFVQLTKGHHHLDQEVDRVVIRSQLSRAVV